MKPEAFPRAEPRAKHETQELSCEGVCDPQLSCDHRAVTDSNELHHMASMTRSAIGVKMIMKTSGKMNRTNGISMSTGACMAFFSAR